jgi:dodecin
MPRSYGRICLPGCRKIRHATCNTAGVAAPRRARHPEVQEEVKAMSIAKIIEISAESTKGFDDAVESGLKKAAETVQNIESAWIKDHVVVADNGKIVRYRVHMHVTFKVR